MTVLPEFNARTAPSSDVAKSFIPPEDHFASLLSGNHTLLLGPRGSGKTTLFKMLTVRALRNWNHVEAPNYSRQLKFNAVFIPADTAWGKQIETFDEAPRRPGGKEAAFILHTLRALIRAMREAVDLGRSSPPAHLAHLAVELTTQQEEQLVRLLVDALRIAPVVSSLLGVELAFESLLDAMNSGVSTAEFNVDAMPSKISTIVAAFNGVTGDADRRWALLFDEVEIAPPRIKSFLLAGMRSSDDRIIVKLALAPYMDDAGFERTAISPQPLHDFQTIKLTYPNKHDAARFSEDLFRSTFARFGFEIDSLSAIFSHPPEGMGFVARSTRHAGRKSLPPAFASLALKDASFKRYIAARGLTSPTYIFNEANVAQDIRKVLPIVVARDYYIRQFTGSHVAFHRSRKSKPLYAGFPSIIEVTEGNPRAILTLVTHLVQGLSINLREDSHLQKIGTALQSQAIARIELLLTSLLQVVPLDFQGIEARKGLLGFVDEIGRAFETLLLRRPFRTDYVGAFTLNEQVDPAIVSAVGKALNAGALIHIPYEDSGPDILMRGLVGQRFRLSYSLAPRYRLLLTLGDTTSLSKLLHEARGVDVQEIQPSLLADLERDS
jgi:hypothetical protein